MDMDKLLLPRDNQWQECEVSVSQHTCTPFAAHSWKPALMTLYPWFKSLHPCSFWIISENEVMVYLWTLVALTQDKFWANFSLISLWSHLQKGTSAGATSTTAALACASAPLGCVMGTTTAGTGLMKPTVLVSISWTLNSCSLFMC